MRRFLCAWIISLALLAILTSSVLADSGIVRTSAGFIWVRSGPGTTYPIIGRVYNGTAVNITGTAVGQAVYRGNSTWYLVGPGRYVYSGLVQATAAPAATPTTPEAPTAAASGAKWIEVILSQQRLIAHQGSQVVMNTLISSGTAIHPTVRGYFRVYVKYAYTRMAGPGYNLPNVPSTMYFYGGYAIHGAYWHNNFGHPMSHGCVNMRLGDAAWLFNWAPVGTTVYVH
jgi:lipoprotein-anchoring transpeptidase ErfK/SrfK